MQPGQGLVVMEAMKMENELRATAAATVKAVLAQPGTAVEKGALTALESFLVGSADGTVGKGEQVLRTGSTVVEPVTVPRPRWPLLPRLVAKVA